MLIYYLEYIAFHEKPVSDFNEMYVMEQFMASITIGYKIVHAIITTPIFVRSVL